MVLAAAIVDSRTLFFIFLASCLLYPNSVVKVQGSGPERYEGAALRSLANDSELEETTASIASATIVEEGATVLPKIALLFLTRGRLPHERTWRAFLDAASALISTKGSSKNEHLWQQLFSIHVHPAPNYPGFPQDSLFYDKVVSRRVKVQWGQQSVVEAERILLKAAMADPLNQRFVLLSESCIPLYGPGVFYLQAFTDQRSRLQACTNPKDPRDAQRRMTYRWHPSMQSEKLRLEHWRKSSQWFMLLRKHAELVVADRHIYERFAEGCWADLENWLKGRPAKRFCVSDEHYIPTLLAAYQLTPETDCKGAMTSVTWRGGQSHPVTFQRSQVSAELFNRLRKVGQEGCDVEQAVVTASLVWARARQEHLASRTWSTLFATNCNESQFIAQNADPPALDSEEAAEEAEEAARTPEAGSRRLLEGPWAGGSMAAGSRRLTTMLRRAHLRTAPLRKFKPPPSLDVEAERPEAPAGGWGQDDTAAVHAALAVQVCTTQDTGYQPLGPHCPLLARKFTGHSAPQVEALFRAFLVAESVDA